MIDGHGNNLYAYGEENIKADFSSNIAYNNNSDKIIDFLKENMDCIKNYPDPQCNKLSTLLAQRCKTKKENILVTNGSAEAFYLVAHLLSSIAKKKKKECKSLIFTPSFSEYEDSCTLFGHKIEYIPLLSSSPIDYASFNSVWLCSPNNPTGMRKELKEIEKVCNQNKNTLFIIDRAYNDLSLRYEEEKLLPENTFSIHSLTKSFGIPGLRLGYIIAEEGYIKELSQMRPPWSVNALALKAGEFILENYEKLSVNYEKLMQESFLLQEEIKKIPYIDIVESQGNFFLCFLKGDKQKKVKDLSSYLLDTHGILIRDASNFRDLDESSFRLSVQSPEKNKLLINALWEWI